MIASENIDNFLKGINLSIFAYGQTSTGKTFTMKGPAQTLDGIIPSSIREIFRRLNDEKNIKYTLKISYLEIYNETVNDLLDPTKKNLEIRESLQRGIFVNNLTEIPVGSFDKAMGLFKQGDQNRVMAETKLNEKSSRSHTIFRLSLEVSKIVDGKAKTYMSQFNMIDLAGSENVSKAKTDGIRMKEGGNINKSLLALSNVISKLSSNPKSFVNYRDSKLTRLLQNVLNGNCKTMVICTITESSSCYAETMNTLHFGLKAKNIKTSIKVNEFLDEKSKIVMENNQLKSKIKQLEDLMKGGEGDSQGFIPNNNSFNYQGKNDSNNKGNDEQNKSQSEMISALEKEINLLKRILMSNEEIGEDVSCISNEISVHSNNYNINMGMGNLMQSAQKYKASSSTGVPNLASMLSSGKKMTDSARKMPNHSSSLAHNLNYSSRNEFHEPEYNQNSSSVFKRCMTDMKMDMKIEPKQPTSNFLSMSGMNNYNNLSSKKYSNNNPMFSAYKSQLHQNDSDLDFLCPSEFGNTNNNINSDNYYSLLKENDDLRKNLYEVRKNYIETVQQKENQIKSLNYNLNLTMENCEKLIREAEENYMNLKLNYDRLKEDIQTKETENKNLTQKIRNLEASNNFYNEEINKLNQEIIKLNENLYRETRLKETEMKLCDLQKIYENMKREFEFDKNYIIELKQQNDKFKSENGSMKIQIESHKSENLSYKTQYDVLKKNYDLLTAENSKLKNDLESYKNELIQHKDKLSKMRGELNQLKSKLESQNDKKDKENNYTSICSKNKSNDKKGAVNATLVQNQMKIDEMEKTINSQSTYIIQLETQVSELKSNLFKIEHTQIVEYQKLLDESFSKINDLQSDLELANEKNGYLEKLIKIEKIQSGTEKKSKNPSQTPFREISQSTTDKKTEITSLNENQMKNVSHFCISEKDLIMNSSNSINQSLPLKEENLPNLENIENTNTLNLQENNDSLNTTCNDNNNKDIEFLGKKRKYLPRVYQSMIEKNINNNGILSTANKNSENTLVKYFFKFRLLIVLLKITNTPIPIKK